MVELHRVAELATKDLIIRLWPAEAIPGSYFGLMKRLLDACRRLDVDKRSIRIEGARLAFSYCKVWWVKLDAVKLVTEGLPEGKEHRTPSDTSAMSWRGPALLRIIMRKTLSLNECIRAPSTLYDKTK